MNHMKKISLSIAFLFTAVITRAQNKIDVLHYTFNINLNDANDTISGIAYINFVVKEKKPGNQVQLDLSNIDSKGKGMMVNGLITIDGGTVSPKIIHEKNVLKIELTGDINNNDTVLLSINYQGIPSDGLIISKNKFGKRTFFSDNWPNRAHHWLPCKDEPGDKASVDFVVTAPDHYQVISNGIQIEETNNSGNKKTTAYHEAIPLPTKIMVIGVAEFAVHHSGMVNDCIPVSSWVFPGNSANGSDDYSIAPEILKFYITMIGPYPYKKLANVQSKTIFGGMENANAIFYFENSVNGKRDQETLIAHEIVHQWFGNMATEKSFAHIWLSEGFATYLTHMYVESKYGQDSLWKRLRAEREEIIEFTKQSKRPVVDSTRDYMSLLNTNSYQKGSWVLHMLRNKIGDSAFRKGIRQYYAEFAGKNAETKDLQRIIETVSGKDLKQFIKQWLYTPENPSFDISWRYDAKSKQVKIHLKQLTNTPFDVLLDFALVTNSGAGAKYKGAVNKREHDFSFSMPEKPATVAISDLVNLLYEARITESK